MSFDRYARLVRRAVGAPISLVTLVESERQVFVGAVGLAEPYRSGRQTPLSHSFCQYVVEDRAPLVVSDARFDQRLCGNGAIQDLQVVAYAGWPLVDAYQEVIGSLCAIHSEPHAWSQEELETLADLAAACSAELVQRELAADLATAVTVLTQAVDELETSNEKLGAYAAQVSHDLRNPLAALAASLELLDDLRGDAAPDLDSPVGSLLTRARRSARRMTTLVHDVLDYARVGGELAWTDVDVDVLVRSVVEDLHLEPGAGPVRVGRTSDVHADPVQLGIVVQNLLANALKHAPGSVVEISAEVVGDTWRLVVADHGPGIPQAERARVFESLVQLDTAVDGSGLGLATCARIARAHAGGIEASETPGGGTSVTVVLPRVRRPAAQVDNPVADEPALGTTTMVPGSVPVT